MSFAPLCMIPMAGSFGSRPWFAASLWISSGCPPPSMCFAAASMKSFLFPGFGAAAVGARHPSHRSLGGDVDVIDTRRFDEVLHAAPIRNRKLNFRVPRTRVRAKVGRSDEPDFRTMGPYFLGKACIRAHDPIELGVPGIRGDENSHF